MQLCLIKYCHMNLFHFLTSFSVKMPTVQRQQLHAYVQLRHGERSGYYGNYKFGFDYCQYNLYFYNCYRCFKGTFQVFKFVVHLVFLFLFVYFPYWLVSVSLSIKATDGVDVRNAFTCQIILPSTTE
jgi:hypothetical protein